MRRMLEGVKRGLDVISWRHGCSIFTIMCEDEDGTFESGMATSPHAEGLRTTTLNRTPSRGAYNPKPGSTVVETLRGQGKRQVQKCRTLHRASACRAASSRTVNLRTESTALRGGGVPCTLSTRSGSSSACCPAQERSARGRSVPRVSPSPTGSTRSTHLVRSRVQVPLLLLRTQHTRGKR